MFKNQRGSSEPTPVILGGIVVVLFLAIFLIWVMSPFTIIDTGNKGIVLKWGAIQDEVLDEGFHMCMPIKTRIKKVTIQPVLIEIEIPVGINGAITKDNQTVGATINTFYIYKKESLVDMWKNYGIEQIENIINTTVRETFKIVIGQYDIFTVAENKAKIKLELEEKVASEMTNYPVSITELKINNYDWSDDFDAQIEITMKKAQQVKQAEQELLITEKNAQKQVKEAEAQKTALITKAEGMKEAEALNAEAKALEGEGLRNYNESIRATKDIEIMIRELAIEQERVDKWNGIYVPNNMYGPIPVDTQGGVQGR